MPREPYNKNFCQFKGCQSLDEIGKCRKRKCIFNPKRIKHWELCGKYPAGGE